MKANVTIHANIVVERDGVLTGGVAVAYFPCEIRWSVMRPDDRIRSDFPLPTCVREISVEAPEDHVFRQMFDREWVAFRTERYDWLDLAAELERDVALWRGETLWFWQRYELGFAILNKLAWRLSAVVAALRLGATS